MTAKEQKFCEEYLVDLNATQSAIRAGYSKKAAKEIGYENLTKPHIQAEISKKRAELSQKTAITQEWVLNNFVKLQKLAEETGDFPASIKANEMIGKHLGFFEKDNSQSAVIINVKVPGEYDN